MNNVTLDRDYEIEMNKDKIHNLSSKIWDALNEVDYDPMCPKFENFDDPLKDKIIEFSTLLVVPTEGI